jgi:hypothetical protein
MRDRPFISAGESPRLYSDVLAEREPDYARKRTLDRIVELEAEASEQTDPDERKRLLCEAEALRCSLSEHSPTRWP